MDSLAAGLQVAAKSRLGLMQAASRQPYSSLAGCRCQRLPLGLVASASMLSFAVSQQKQPYSSKCLRPLSGLLTSASRQPYSSLHTECLRTPSGLVASASRLPLLVVGVKGHRRVLWRAQA